MIAQTMPLPKALLLDLDETILDAYGNPDAAWLPLCSEFAERLGSVTAEALHAAVIESREWVWSDAERARLARHDLAETRRRVVRGAFARLNLTDTAVANSMADRFTAAREEAIKPFPGAIEALGKLREAGVRLALLTNGEARRQRDKIARFGLEPFFDHIQIEEEFGVGKPDVRAFRNALSVLGVEAEEAWMVGDSLEWDIEGPRGRASMPSGWTRAGTGRRRGRRPSRTGTSGRSRSWWSSSARGGSSPRGGPIRQTAPR